MTIWRVGLRVRKVRSGAFNSLQPIGSEGTIIDMDASCCCVCGWRADSRLRGDEFLIAYDTPVTKVIGCKCNCFFGHKDFIEPIQPSGNKVVSWEQCLWNPRMLEDANKTKEVVIFADSAAPARGHNPD